MADVFISYSRADHDRVAPIAERLTSMGYRIWWDKHLRAGQVFVDEIERQLDDARAVLTAWSHNARDSTWVYAESARGLDAHKFLQIRIDDVQLPLPFDALQVTDLSSRNATWAPLEQALARLVKQGVQEPPKREPRVGFLATPAAVGAPKLLTTATGATLVAYVGALQATYNGVMSPEQFQVALMVMIGIGAASALLTLQRLLAIARAGG